MTAQSSVVPDSVILAPSYRLPLVLGAIALGIAYWTLWVAIPIGVFAIFLGIQATILRAHFTATAFDLYRGNTLIRSFPYQEWLNWEIFWPPVPILFYFREVRNIHFLPILFDPVQLKLSLEQNCVIEDHASMN